MVVGRTQTSVLCLLKSVSDKRNESSRTTWRLQPQPDFHIFDGSYLYWESWGRQKIFCWCEGGSFKLHISIWGGAGNCRADGGSKLTSWCYSCGPKVTADYACYSPAEEMPTVKNWGEEKSRLRTSCACFCTHVFHVGILLFFLLSLFCQQRETWKRAKEGQPYLYLCTCCFSYLYLCTCCFFAFQATVTELLQMKSSAGDVKGIAQGMIWEVTLSPDLSSFLAYWRAAAAGPLPVTSVQCTRCERAQHGEGRWLMQGARSTFVKIIVVQNAVGLHDLCLSMKSWVRWRIKWKVSWSLKQRRSQEGQDRCEGELGSGDGHDASPRLETWVA